MPAVAITDHGNMFGVIEFYKEATKAGIKPIIGCEVYLAPMGMLDRSDKTPPHHLTLLAADENGYKNLMALSSLGYLKGHHYRPRIDLELLAKHSQGLIGLSGCLKGLLSTEILKGESEKATAAAQRLREILGDGNFFLELMDNGLAEQNLVNEHLLVISHQLGIPPVATNDCHYLEATDRETQDVMLCIQTGKTLAEKERLKFESESLYFRSPSEMRNAFNYCPEAIENTLLIADRCSLEIKLGNFYLPKFATEMSAADSDRMLEEKVVNDFAKKKTTLLANNPTADIGVYEQRLHDELAVIKKANFAGYFLIVSDFVEYAHRNDIPVGPGRGSAAGSLVAYCLGITSIDPIKYNLLFERFLNLARITMPDIDIDFCPERREEIIAYVANKYGEERVAQIITFGTLGARAAIRDVGRVLGIPYGEVDAIAKLIPSRLRISIEEAVKEEPRLEEARKKDSNIERLLKIAMSVEGLSRHASIHAAGVVISDVPLLERVPLYKNPKDQLIATQYPMLDIEAVGLLKFDFLGLKTLTLLKNTVSLVAETQGIKIDLDNLPLEDEKTYQLLQSGNTEGVFQVESEGMKRLLIDAKPDRFEDIIALIALYRPGPMEMIPDFVKRKHGEEKIKHIIPELEDILKDTYGVMLYQEQVMQIASKVGGFSLAEADNLRRMMSKKDSTKMAQQKPKFIAGAKENKIPESKAIRTWEQMEKFAEYGFNKSHSAAYAMISFQTAYLKAHYPLEFAASLLSSEENNRDKIVKYLNYYRSQGMGILPPDVNESISNFSVSGENIRFGLSAIKNVGKSIIEELIKERNKGGKFKDFFDFSTRMGGKKINKKVLESLIMAGAFDTLESNRALLLANYENIFDYIQKDVAANRFQANLFEKEDTNTPKSYSFLMDTASTTPWSVKEKLAKEKNILGFYVTGHPLDDFRDILAIEANCDIASLDNKGDGEKVVLGGIINSIRTIKTKTGSEMAYINVEDLTGIAEMIVFQDVFARSRNLLVEGELIFIRGSVDVNEDDETLNIKMKVEELTPLSEMKKDYKVLTIILSAQSSAAETLIKEVLNILKSEGEGGSKKVVVCLRAYQSELLIELGKKFMITPNLKKRLETLLGVGQVILS